MVLALLLKSDYPETWTDAFEQLQSLLVVRDGAAHVDLYLRVLCALDEEVVAFHVDRSREETEHNSLIKVRAQARGVHANGTCSGRGASGHISRWG